MFCFLWDRGHELDPRGVEHDADGGALSLRGEIVAEVSADDASVAVGLGDAAPDDADGAALDGLLGAVDVRDALAEVVVGVLAVLDALNADEGGLLLLVVVAPTRRNRGQKKKKAAKEGRAQVTSKGTLENENKIAYPRTQYSTTNQITW